MIHLLTYHALTLVLILMFFILLPQNEISKLTSESPDTHCDLDLILCSLLKQCTYALLPTITTTINLSISLQVFPDQLKCSSAYPLPLKPSCDTNDPSNCTLFLPFLPL